MCGITAVIKKDNFKLSFEILQRINREVAHRGPDDEGYKCFRNKLKTNESLFASDSDWEVGLGHRRLSIIDLSEAGNQPMSIENNYWITFNGEIYNYIELKAELIKLGYSFTTKTDTEVILKAYAAWGTKCFERFNGMWGMVLYDLVNNVVIVSRDRIGIKPVYIYQNKDYIAICSEIKQLKHIPNWQYNINIETAIEYLQTGYESHTDSFFADVHPIEPGTYIEIDPNDLSVSEKQPFWFPENIKPEIDDQIEAAASFNNIFLSSILLRLRSDVPIGSFLSGGLDSSSIVCTIDKMFSDNKPLNTFSMVFDGFKMDERRYVDSVLNKINKPNGYFIQPDPREFINKLNDFIYTHDEPVGGPSIYAGYCLASLAKEKNVTVILNGQGGDETLGGYWQSYYIFLLNLLKSGRYLNFSKHYFGSLLPYNNQNLIKQSFFILNRFNNKRKKNTLSLKYKSRTNGKLSLLSDFMKMSPHEKRIYEIRYLHLPRLLKWDDRNTMAFSLEGRYPFLDHRLIELCLSFSQDVLYNAGWTKMPLRIGMKDILPNMVSTRKSKFGFEVPIESWLQEFSKDYLGSMRKRNDLRVREIIEDKSINTLISDHKNNDSCQKALRLIFLETWLQVFNVSISN